MIFIKPMEIKISAVVVALNDEKTVGQCLESVGKVADEILVIDGYSTDRTEEICRSHGAVFIRHIPRGYIEQRSWAVGQATFPYILYLEPNERLTPQLMESISMVKKGWRHDGYCINRLNRYCGKWLYRNSWYHDRKLRLWDSRKGDWGGLNPYVEVKMERQATRKFLNGNLLHYSYDNIMEHLNQVELLSSVAAQSCFEQGKRSNIVFITLSPLWRFLKDYFSRLGFLDGYYGLLKSVISAHAIFLKHVKLMQHHIDHIKARKQTICFFNSNPDWGGGERWHFEVSGNLYNSGHQILVFTSRSGGLRKRVLHSGIPSYGIRVNNLSFLNPFKILKIAGILKRKGVRVIIMNLSADVKVAGLAAKIAGVERIIYRRGSAIPIKDNFLNRFMMHRVVSEFMANSYETKRTILGNMPGLIDPSKIRVIYNGMQFEKYESGVFNPCYEGKEGEIILGNAGRLVKQKAQEYLIDLAVELKKHNLEFRIIIAGDGRLKEKLVEYARSSGVEDRIVFLGFIKDMKSFMDSIDIFVLTSLWEGFGYVIVEAMANAKPVVAFDVSSNPEIIEDGKNGFLIPPFDVNLLSERIIQLTKDMKLRMELGNFAKKSVYERFGFDIAMNTLDKYLMENNGI